MNRRVLKLFALGVVAFSSVQAVAGPATLPGLTNEYRFDDGSGTTAVDSIGANNATLSSFSPGNGQWISGMFGGGLKITNASAYTITNAPIPSNLFSVSFWTRLNANSTSNDSDLLTPLGDNWITYNRSGGQGIGIGSVRDANAPLQGIWENYVVTVDRAAGNILVYRDGALRASGTVSLPNLNAPWVFGHNQDASNTNGSYDGAFDEIQFYNRVLSASDAASLAARPPQPGISAHLVTATHLYGSQPSGQFATVSTSFFVDPAATNWIAWNRFPDLRAVSDSQPGALVLGTYTPEVDDYFNLTITNPSNQKLTVAMDQNGVLGAPTGPQSVVFGAAGAAPTVARGDNLGSPSLFTETGPFNSIFTTAGTYTFDFSFQNIGGLAGYPDMYLLVAAVPEPPTGILGVIGLSLACSLRVFASGKGRLAAALALA
jgi:hypothetical protein